MLPPDEARQYELSHPLNGMPCPVTGHLLETRWEWGMDEPGYRLKVGVLEPGVLVSLPVGHTDMRRSDAFFDVVKEIQGRGLLERGKFVLIEDYTLHSGADYDSRLNYMRRMMEEIHPSGIVFCTRSMGWRINIRAGHVLARPGFPVRIVGNYTEALEAAATLLDRPLLSGVVSAETSFTYENSRFRYHVEIQGRGRILAVYQGVSSSECVEPVLELYEKAVHRLLSMQGVSSYVTIHDFSSLSEVSFQTVRMFQSGLMRLKDHSRFRMAVVVGGSHLVRIALGMSRFLSDSQVRHATTLPEAVALLDELDSKDHGLEASSASTAFPKMDAEGREQVESALQLLDQLRWDVSGTALLDAFPSGSPLKPLATALALMKSDVDRFLEEREAEFSQLEQAQARMSRLAEETEAALQRSHENRVRLLRIHKENMGLVMDIGQTQKELLVVLADILDERIGEFKGHTKAMAQIGFLLARQVGMPESDATQVHDACCLHDVGLLGVDDAVAQVDRTREVAEEVLYRSHCEIGEGVLRRLHGDAARVYSMVALGHHEHWDGSGFPRQLSGDSIPLPARIAAVAEYLEAILRKYATDELVREHLDSLAGTVLDPTLVHVVLERWTEYRATWEEGTTLSTREPRKS